MTDYAADASGARLVATWRTGMGREAVTVAALPTVGSHEDAVVLARRLEELSRHCWRTYTHPALAAGDPTVPNTEAWRRTAEAHALARVPAIVQSPNMPSGGLLVTSYLAVEECAHALGRSLHSVPSADVRSAVLTEVDEELDAIARAALGDLAGRAQQAVHLSRTEAAPTAVAAAFAQLAEQPLSAGADLLGSFDPAAAAVAAAAWLQGAAQITAQMAGCEVRAVVREADDIEALAWETPTEVLRRMEEGEEPRRAVTGLIADALDVAEGRAPAHTGPPGQLAWLDPGRPAPDLLEDLLDGIWGCYLLWSECGGGDDGWAGSSAAWGHGALADAESEAARAGEEGEAVFESILREHMRRFVGVDL